MNQIDTSKFAVVGERPGTEEYLPEDDCCGATGARLAKYMGVDDATYRQFTRVNMWEYADKVSMAPAKKRVEEVIAPMIDGKIAILMGRSVARAFGLTKASFLSVWSLKRGGKRFLVVPVSHTSGRSRWYNDPANRDATVAFFKQLGEIYETLLKPPLEGYTDEDTLISTTIGNAPKPKLPAKKKAAAKKKAEPEPETAKQLHEETAAAEERPIKELTVEPVEA